MSLKEKLMKNESDGYLYPIDSYQYFVGKVCSIFTVGTSISLPAERWHECFTGVVNYVDEHGIWYTNITTKQKSYCFLKHVITISEELVVDKNDPKVKSNPKFQEILKKGSNSKKVNKDHQLAILNQDANSVCGSEDKCSS